MNVPLEQVSGIRLAPMSGARFNVYVRAITQEFDKHATETRIKEITYHRWRHLLPTLADRSMMPASERTSVGLWTGSRDDEGTANLARRMAMPLLYASEKGISEAVTKTELVRGSRRAIIKHLYMGKKLEASWLYKRYQQDQSILPSLDRLVPVWPTREDVTHETKDYIRPKLNAEIRTEPPQLCDGQCLPFEHPHEECEEASEGITSQSSDSIGDSVGSGVGDVQGILEFVHGQRIDSRLHLKHQGADPVLDSGLTMCGRRLKDVEVGSTAAEALATGREWSPRCYRELAHDVRALWL